MSLLYDRYYHYYSYFSKPAPGYLIHGKEIYRKDILAVAPFIYWYAAPATAGEWAAHYYSSEIVEAKGDVVDATITFYEDEHTWNGATLYISNHPFSVRCFKEINRCTDGSGMWKEKIEIPGNLILFGSEGNTEYLKAFEKIVSAFPEYFLLTEEGRKIAEKLGTIDIERTGKEVPNIWQMIDQREIDRSAPFINNLALIKGICYDLIDFIRDMVNLHKNALDIQYEITAERGVERIAHPLINSNPYEAFSVISSLLIFAEPQEIFNITYGVINGTVRKWIYDLILTSDATKSDHRVWTTVRNFEEKQYRGDIWISF